MYARNSQYNLAIAFYVQDLSSCMKKGGTELGHAFRQYSNFVMTLQRTGCLALRGSAAREKAAAREENQGKLWAFFTLTLNDLGGKLVGLQI